VKTKVISYWTTTIILVLSILPSSRAQSVYEPQITAIITKLDYRFYFVTILGFWKVVGSIALFVPRFPRVKDWMYAGIFFEMTGAFASHAACGS